jgi:hypothetical protein
VETPVVMLIRFMLAPSCAQSDDEHVAHEHDAQIY